MILRKSFFLTQGCGITTAFAARLERMDLPGEYTQAR